jgi:hypothetical protein
VRSLDILASGLEIHRLKQEYLDYDEQPTAAQLSSSAFYKLNAKGRAGDLGVAALVLIDLKNFEKTMSLAETILDAATMSSAPSRLWSRLLEGSL